MRRCVVYVRVSSDKQAREDATSLALQEADCRRYAEREGWEVVGVNQDTITAHDTMDQRPGLQEVRRILRDRQADIVLCWATSRIMRDQTDMMLFARECYEAGGQIVSVTEGVFDQTPTGKLLLSILGWKDEQERITIRDRLHGNMRAQVTQGRIKPGSNALYGYTWTGDTKNGYTVNEEVAPVVRRIFQMIDDGLSLHGVSVKLNAEGVPTPSAYAASQGRPIGRVSPAWRRQHIIQLVSNPTYCGRYVAYRFKTVKGKNGKRIPTLLPDTDERRIELVGMVPAIVTPEQWERVQQAVRDRTLAPAVRPDDEHKPLLLNGYGVCGVCGERVTVGKHRDGGTGYICTHRPSRVARGQVACPGGSWFLRVSEVDDAVWLQVSEMARDTETFRAMLQAPMRQAQDKLAEANRREGAIRAELEAARKDLETIGRRMSTEADDAIYAMHKQRYQEVKRLISGLETRLTQTGQTEDKLSAYLAGIASAVALLPTGGPERIGPFAADMARSVARASGLDDAAVEAHMDKLMDDGTYASAAYETGLLVPTRDQKRTLLRAIGARVAMYAAKSEYALTHEGRRWELRVGIPDDGNCAQSA